jgi:hypothetical protein
MKKYYHHTSFLVVSISSLVLLILVFIYVLNSIDSVVSNALNAKNNANIQVERSFKEKEIIKTYSTTIKEREDLKKSFVPADESLVFIETLEAIGDKTGSKIVISGLDTKESEATTTPFGTISAHIDAVGSWNAVWKTLKLVELMPYISVISNIRLDTSISNTGSGSNNWKLSVDIKSKTFKKK